MSQPGWHERLAQPKAFDAVAALAGAKRIERTPPGQYVMTVDGVWQEK